MKQVSRFAFIPACIIALLAAGVILYTEGVLGGKAQSRQGLGMTLPAGDSEIGSANPTPTAIEQKLPSAEEEGPKVLPPIRVDRQQILSDMVTRLKNGENPPDAIGDLTSEEIDYIVSQLGQ